MAVFPPGLVWLASYPKSGNTWMRILLANLLVGGDKPVNINRLGLREDLEESFISKSAILEDTLVDADLLSPPELERMLARRAAYLSTRLTTPCFCKTHEHFHGRTGGSMVARHARAALYILRDPRDVAVSYTHHRGRNIDKTIVKMRGATELLGGGKQVRYLLGDWASHVAGWTTQQVLPVKIIRYEDMRADTVACLTDILAFLGIVADKAEIIRAVAHADFAELRRQEDARGFNEAMPGQERFFRAGQVGEWRTVLTPEQVARIEESFAPVMQRWGYATGQNS